MRARAKAREIDFLLLGVILLIGIFVVAFIIVEKARARGEGVRRCVFVITTLWRNRRAKYKK